MIRGSRRKKRAMLLGTTLLMLAAASAVYVIPSAAVDPPPPIQAEPLTPRSVFPDEIDMKIKLKHARGHDGGPRRRPVPHGVVKYTVQPGAQFPWHSHRGPVVVNLMSGTLDYIPAGTCDEQTYSGGQSFIDPGHGHVHSARNDGTEPTVFIATFFEAPETGPLLIPAAPGC